MKKFLYYLFYAGLCSATLIPCMVSSSLIESYNSIKLFYFSLLTEILFCGWIGFAIFYKEFRPRFSWLYIAVIFFLCSFAISNIWNFHTYQSMVGDTIRLEGWILFAHLAIFMLILSTMIKTQKQWDVFFFFYVIVFWLYILFYGFNGLIPESSTLSFWQKYTQIFHLHHQRLIGPQGNAALFGIYLIFHIYFTIYCIYRLYSEYKKARYVIPIFIIGILLDFWLLYTTGTRSAILGLFLSLFFVICCVIYKSPKKIQKISIICFCIILILGSIFLWYAFENKEKFQTIPILGRFFSIHGTVGIQIREYTWPIAWKGFCDQPIFGWGQENYAYVFNKYYHPSLYYEKGEWCDRAHNVFLERLVTGGIFGFLSYISIYIAFFYTLWKKRKFSWINIFFSALCLAYLVFLTFSFDNIVSHISFVSILAYAISQSHIHEKFSIEQCEQQIIPHKIILILPFLFCFYGFFYWHLPNIQAFSLTVQAKMEKKDAIKAFLQYAEAAKITNINTFAFRTNLLGFHMNLVKTNYPNDFKYQVMQCCEAELTKQIQELPYYIRAYDMLSMFYKSIGNMEQGMKMREKTIELSPKRQILHMDLASYYMFHKQDTPKALQIAQNAYEILPLYNNIRIHYAKLLIFATYLQENEEYFIKAMKILNTQTAIQPYTKQEIQLKDLRLDIEIAEAIFNTDKLSFLQNMLEKIYKEDNSYAYAKYLYHTYLRKNNTQKAQTLLQSFPENNSTQNLTTPFQKEYIEWKKVDIE
ncbi:MAG: O-antigen ligase family protein [Planctomycetes bacterium]|nr:O-antigen ligase family protein [Planctomycetota bacterium]HPY75278.1 O-antigen ligase family protein [Planctomycetota bacterium]HQB00947.1 O-antigen ligase family protein [Planctomycetota bacterium]